MTPVQGNGRNELNIRRDSSFRTTELLATCVSHRWGTVNKQLLNRNHQISQQPKPHLEHQHERNE